MNSKLVFLTELGDVGTCMTVSLIAKFNKQGLVSLCCEEDISDQGLIPGTVVFNARLNERTRITVSSIAGIHSLQSVKVATHTFYSLNGLKLRGFAPGEIDFVNDIMARFPNCHFRVYMMPEDFYDHSIGAKSSSQPLSKTYSATRAHAS